MSNAAVMVNDKDTGLIIRTVLECAGYEVRSCDDALAVLRGIRHHDLRLVVLDIDDNSEWHSVLEGRRNWLQPRVVVVAVGADDDRAAARALKAGADDYLAKPVRGAELLARIDTAAGWRADAVDRRAIEVGGCIVDRASSSLRTQRDRVALTNRELGVLQILFENAGRPVTRQRLAAEVWGLDADLSGRTIEQHVYQIRRKLRLCAGATLGVRNVYGCGYQLDVGGGVMDAAAHHPVDAPAAALGMSRAAKAACKPRQLAHLVDGGNR